MSVLRLQVINDLINGIQCCYDSISISSVS